MIAAASRRVPSRTWRAVLLGRGPIWAQVANAIALAGLVAYGLYFSTAGPHAGDAHAYWAADLTNPYTTGVNEEDAYLYAPAFLLIISPLQLLPWEVFWIVWTALNLAVLAWVIGPVLAVIVLLPGAYSPVWVNLWYGNIAILMAAALVLVFRYSGAWSFLLLTKVTPGIGLAWFAARREWRYLRNAFLITLAITAVSFLITPGPWLEWPRHLAESSGREDVFVEMPPLWIRLIGAMAIAALGGLFSARWTVPLAALLAQPVFWFTGFSILIAWLGLVRHRRWLGGLAAEASGLQGYADDREEEAEVRLRSGRGEAEEDKEARGSEQDRSPPAAPHER